MYAVLNVVKLFLISYSNIQARPARLQLSQLFLMIRVWFENGRILANISICPLTHFPVSISILRLKLNYATFFELTNEIFNSWLRKNCVFIYLNLEPSQMYK